MKCPVCGEDHIICSEDLPSRPSELFAPCLECNPQVRPKNLPVSSEDVVNGPCTCNRRFIDDVMAGLYQVLEKHGVITGREPLSALGTPLISPGLFLRRPPVLPPRSLLLVSEIIPYSIADIAWQEVPELMGIIHRSSGVPGPGDVTGMHIPSFLEGRLLCGCDIRTDIFSSSKGPVIIVKKQAAMHIEFPKGIDQKVVSVEEHVRRIRPDIFIDACAGPGTLGIIASLFGVSHVIMCDVWQASIWSAIQSLYANRTKLDITKISILEDISLRPPVWSEKPVLICEAYGDGFQITVCHGSYELLGPDLPSGRRLTVFDPFDKATFSKNVQFLAFWKEKIGGEVFIP